MPSAEEIDAMRQQIRQLQMDVERLQPQYSIDDGITRMEPPTAVAAVPENATAVCPGTYHRNPREERGDYPRRSFLSVLAGREGDIRIHDAEHVTWCVDQFLEADPGTGGEETLDQDVAEGVTIAKLAAIGDLPTPPMASLLLLRRPRMY
jgi:hypothetical protein